MRLLRPSAGRRFSFAPVALSPRQTCFPSPATRQRPRHRGCADAGEQKTGWGGPATESAHQRQAAPGQAAAVISQYMAFVR